MDECRETVAIVIDCDSVSLILRDGEDDINIVDIGIFEKNIIFMKYFRFNIKN